MIIVTFLIFSIDPAGAANPQDSAKNADYTIKNIKDYNLTKIKVKIEDLHSGTIIQLINDKGYICYLAYRRSADPQGKIVILLDGDGNLIPMSLTKFKQIYTGTGFKIGNPRDCVPIVKQITKKQKEDIKNRRSYR